MFSSQINSISIFDGHTAASTTYLIVCAHIQQDRQALLRRHTSTGCVKGQLAHWDAHTIAAQVPQSQDPLSIRHTNSLKINKLVTTQIT